LAQKISARGFFLHLAVLLHVPYIDTFFLNIYIIDKHHLPERIAKCIKVTLLANLPPLGRHHALLQQPTAAPPPSPCRHFYAEFSAAADNEQMVCQINRICKKMLIFVCRGMMTLEFMCDMRHCVNQ
jgi:hypothetical protein